VTKHNSPNDWGEKGCTKGAKKNKVLNNLKPKKIAKNVGSGNAKNEEGNMVEKYKPDQKRGTGRLEKQRNPSRKFIQKKLVGKRKGASDDSNNHAAQQNGEKPQIGEDSLGGPTSTETGEETSIGGEREAI